MSSEPAGLGVLGVYRAPFTDQAIERIRATYQKFFKQPARVETAQANFWDKLCTEADRRFLCKVAGMPDEYAGASAVQLTAGELLALFDAFLRLCQWCDARRRTAI